MTRLPYETFPLPCGIADDSGRPSVRCVCTDEIAHSLGRLDDGCVLVWSELTAAIFQLTPQSMQMNGMLHHRVVDSPCVLALFPCSSLARLSPAIANLSPVGSGIGIPLSSAFAESSFVFTIDLQNSCFAFVPR